MNPILSKLPGIGGGAMIDFERYPYSHSSSTDHYVVLRRGDVQTQLRFAQRYDEATGEYAVGPLKDLVVMNGDIRTYAVSMVPGLERPARVGSSPRV